MIDADRNLTGDESHFATCLSIIEENLLNRIILSAKDLVGIVCYNTQHSPAPGANTGDSSSADVGQVVPPHTAILWPVQAISKAVIRNVKNMRSSADHHAFATRYGTHVAAANLAEALWLCSRMLTGCDYKLQSASIVLFTNNERPLGDGADAAEEQRVFLRANDLRAMNVDLLVVPLVDRFDDAPFYRELISTVNGLDADTFRMVEPAEQRENLCMRSHQRSLYRACLRHFSLELGDGVRIGCGTYALTQAARIPSRVHLVNATNEGVQTRRCYVSNELDADGEAVERVLLPGELTKYMEVGGQRVSFSLEELANMRGIMAPGMKLLGFKPLAKLPAHSFVKQPSRLLYPSERLVRGSVRLFRALWQRCLARGKFALCVFTQIRKVAPRYVALVPQTEATDGSDGFRIVYLPMQSECRRRVVSVRILF